jgi:hypothetical protein
MTDPVKIIVGEGDITEVQVPEYGIIQTGGGGGGGGSDGATFFPEVSQEGVISWTNDGGYDNPEPVNIKGPAGNDGNDGEDGVTFTPSVSDAGIISWTNDGDLPNPSPVNIKGSDGEDGEDGVSPAVTFGTITGGHTMTVTDKTHPTGQTINIMDGAQGQTGPGVPAGGSTGQVLAKKSNADNDTEWVNQSGGGGGTSDYDDLSNKPSINNVTLSGNKTAAQLGLGTYSKPSTGIPQTDLAQTVQNKLDKTVVVSDTQPTGAENKLWVDTDAGAGASYQIPTVAEMEAADAQTAAEIGIVITGKRPSMAVTAGQYVIVRHSTIGGITDGLYIANSALSPSTDVTAAELTAVSNGGFNELKSKLDALGNPYFRHFKKPNVTCDGNKSVIVDISIGDVPSGWAATAVTSWIDTTDTTSAANYGQTFLLNEWSHVMQTGTGRTMHLMYSNLNSNQAKFTANMLVMYTRV